LEMKSPPKGGWIEILMDQYFSGVFPGGGGGTLNNQELKGQIKRGADHIKDPPLPMEKGLFI
jgi:hypothetical protein